MAGFIRQAQTHGVTEILHADAVQHAARPTNAVENNAHETTPTHTLTQPEATVQVKMPVKTQSLPPTPTLTQTPTKSQVQAQTPEFPLFTASRPLGGSTLAVMPSSRPAPAEVPMLRGSQMSLGTGKKLAGIVDLGDEEEAASVVDHGVGVGKGDGEEGGVPIAAFSSMSVSNSTPPVQPPGHMHLCM